MLSAMISQKYNRNQEAQLAVCGFKFKDLYKLFKLA
jgi:hypothetical protein